MCKVGFTGDSAPRAVFLSFLLSGPHAPHLGRCGPDGQLRGEILADMVCGFSAVAVLQGRRHFLRGTQAVSHGPPDHRDSPVAHQVVQSFLPSWRQAQMLLWSLRSCSPSRSSTVFRGAQADSHGPCDHGDSSVAVLERGDRCPWYAGRAGSSKSFARCEQRQVPSAAAVHQHQQGRLHSCRGAVFDPYGSSIQQTPVAVHTVVHVPVAQVVQIFPVVVQMPIPMVQTARLTMEIPQFVFDKMIDVPVVQYRASSTGAVVEETAEFGVSTASCGMKLALGAGRALCTGPGFDPRHQGGERGGGVAGNLTPR